MYGVYSAKTPTHALRAEHLLLPYMWVSLFLSAIGCTVPQLIVPRKKVINMLHWVLEGLHLDTVLHARDLGPSARGERKHQRALLHTFDSAQSTLAQLAQLRSALRAASFAFLIAPTCATNAFYTPRYLS